jgi:uncharacterized membrane protein
VKRGAAVKKVLYSQDLYPVRTVLATYSIGSVAYTGIELLFRGHTHFSMVLLGGVCGVLLSEIDRRFPRSPLPYRALLGAISITALEFATGLVVNRYLGLGVWDYYGRPLNLLGQICPQFSLAWFFLCFPAILTIGLVRNRLFPCLHGPLFFLSNNT